MMNVSIPAWVDDARCAGAPSDIFFPEGGGHHAAVDYAKNLCAGCPVATQCLSEALADPSLVGVWGGTTEHDRKKLRKDAA